MSQPWQEPPGSAGSAQPGWPSSPRGTVNAWAADELGRIRSGPIWGADDDANGQSSVLDWTPGPAVVPPAAPDAPAAEPDSTRRPPLQLTARGTIAGLLVLFFLVLLMSSWLGWGWLAGLGFLAGSAAAARYTQRRALLAVTVTPPLLFFCDLVVVKALTASGNTLLSTAEGTALTLGSVAPWLFAGVAVALLVAWFRGLPQSVAELRRELHTGPRGSGPAGRSSAPGQPARPRR